MMLNSFKYKWYFKYLLSQGKSSKVSKRKSIDITLEPTLKLSKEFVLFMISSMKKVFYSFKSIEF